MAERARWGLVRFTVSLAEARARARQARQLLLDGIDPIEAKRAKRDKAKAQVTERMLFWDAVTRFLEVHQATWKNAKSLEDLAGAPIWVDRLGLRGWAGNASRSHNWCSGFCVGPLPYGVERPLSFCSESGGQRVARGISAFGTKRTQAERGITSEVRQ
jgi:Arm DNA-binding domain